MSAKEKAEEWAIENHANEWGVLIDPMGGAIAAYLAGYKAALGWVHRSVFSEPVFPGEMPEPMFTIISKDSDAASEAMRIAVKLTKRNIMDAIEKELGDE